MSHAPTARCVNPAPIVRRVGTDAIRKTDANPTEIRHPQTPHFAALTMGIRSDSPLYGQSR